jgi:hypothetical protein
MVDGSIRGSPLTGVLYSGVIFFPNFFLQRRCAEGMRGDSAPMNMNHSFDLTGRHGSH